MTDALGAILDHFGTRELTVARGGVREGAILSLADEARDGNERNRQVKKRGQLHCSQVTS